MTLAVCSLLSAHTQEVRLPGGPHQRLLPATAPDSSLVLRGLGQFEAAATCAQASAVARRLAAGPGGIGGAEGSSSMDVDAASS